MSQQTDRSHRTFTNRPTYADRVGATNPTLDLLGRRLRNLTTVIEALDEIGTELPFAPSISSHSHVDQIDVNFMGAQTDPNRDQFADAKAIMTALGGEWTKTKSANDVYLTHLYGKTRYCIFLDRAAAECVVCGETAESCDCNDRDTNPTDADLAPNWDALSVAEQHEVSARLDAAIEAGH